MKKSLPVILILLLLLPSLAHAGRNDQGFGLGLILGEPSGIDGKLWLGQDTALDAAVAWSTSNNTNLWLHADYVWHKWDVITVQKGRLPLYVGIGGRVAFRESGDDYFGARIPVGLDYMFENSAFDIFFELVPIVDFAPDLEIRFGAAIGGRFFF